MLLLVSFLHFRIHDIRNNLHVGHRFIHICQIPGTENYGEGKLLYGVIVKVLLSESENQPSPEIWQGKVLEVWVPIWSQFVTFSFLKIQLADSLSWQLTKYFSPCWKVVLHLFVVDFSQNWLKGKFYYDHQSNFSNLCWVKVNVTPKILLYSYCKNRSGSFHESLCHWGHGLMLSPNKYFSDKVKQYFWQSNCFFSK